eukprot:1079905-Prymnesium_polylepis.2
MTGALAAHVPPSCVCRGHAQLPIGKILKGRQIALLKTKSTAQRALCSRHRQHRGHSAAYCRADDPH